MCLISVQGKPENAVIHGDFFRFSNFRITGCHSVQILVQVDSFDQAGKVSTGYWDIVFTTETVGDVPYCVVDSAKRSGWLSETVI